MSNFQNSFTYTGTPVTVRSGVGSRHLLSEEIEKKGAHRALILTTKEQANLAEEFSSFCGKYTAGVFTEAVMHTPVQVSERATQYANEIGADIIVSVGGGSTIGLGKAIAYRTDLPQIVIPTTYAGSEATNVLGQTENGTKTTLSDARVQPEVILYDAELVSTLPVNMTVTSALNAMAHAVEGLYARNRNPIATLLAIEGLQAFNDALPRVLESPHDLDARGETLYAAWLCGTVLNQVGMALHHKLCHTLGGSFNLPHAETHAIILPHAIAYNSKSVPELLTPVTTIFGGENAGIALYHFAEKMGAPLALRDLGLKEEDLDRVADIASTNPYWNPRPIERAPLRTLLQEAYEGKKPTL